MVKVGKAHRIPYQVLEKGPLRPKDVTDGDISFEKLEGERARIIFPTKYGNATFEKTSRDEAFLIRWRISPEGTPELTEEHPISVQIFNGAEEICLEYIESSGDSKKS